MIDRTPGTVVIGAARQVWLLAITSSNGGCRSSSWIRTSESVMPGGSGGIRSICLRRAVTTDCQECRFLVHPGLIRPRTRPPTIWRHMPACSSSLSKPASGSSDWRGPGIDSKSHVASKRCSPRTWSWQPAPSTTREFRHSHAIWIRASSNSTRRSTATHPKFRKAPCSSWAPATPERRSPSSSLRINQTWLSGPDTGQEPARAGSRLDHLLTPMMWFVATRLTVKTALGRKLRDHFLDPPRGIPLGRVRRKDFPSAGIERVPRMTGVRNGYPVVEDGRIIEVSNVIWCTGFIPDYSWIDLSLPTRKGFPIHDRGIVDSCPGVYFIGLLFLYSLSSALVGGVGRDAAHIVDHIVSTRLSRREDAVARATTAGRQYA